ncbi:hypothetical protein A3Q56_07463 [Intoshia linei]|uniref:Choline transporter-like protein 2 n=1 Tax=Intoshia linei TaxID=1819745 RepID=A0A177AS57_9BILA|nr:hypothetical protein A3Q56_07463 [Intoshia linei]
MGSNDTGEPTKFDPNFKGPLKNRSCTDIIFLILFIVGIVGMGFVAVLAFVRGDPTKLIYPTDSNGNICGTGNYASRPYLFYFSLLDCATVGPSVLVTGCPTPTVCIEKCPTITFVYSVQQAKEASKISTASGRTNFICIDGFDPLTSSL